MSCFRLILESMILESMIASNRFERGEFFSGSAILTGTDAHSKIRREH